jgi:hypothetical protein
MAKIEAEYRTRGGATVSLWRAGLLGSLAGASSWFECTGCKTKEAVSNWVNEYQHEAVDDAATKAAANAHAANCHRIPKKTRANH